MPGEQILLPGVRKVVYALDKSFGVRPARPGPLPRHQSSSSSSTRAAEVPHVPQVPQVPGSRKTKKRNASKRRAAERAKATKTGTLIPKSKTSTRAVAAGRPRTWRARECLHLKGEAQRPAKVDAGTLATNVDTVLLPIPLSVGVTPLPPAIRQRIPNMEVFVVFPGLRVPMQVMDVPLTLVLYVVSMWPTPWKERIHETKLVLVHLAQLTPAPKMARLTWVMSTWSKGLLPVGSRRAVPAPRARVGEGGDVGGRSIPPIDISKHPCRGPLYSHFPGLPPR